MDSCPVVFPTPCVLGIQNMRIDVVFMNRFRSPLAPNSGMETICNPKGLLVSQVTLQRYILVPFLNSAEPPSTNYGSSAVK